VRQRLSCFFSSRLNPPNNLAILVIASGIFCFSVGCWLGDRFGPKETRHLEAIPVSTQQLLLCLAIAAAGFLSLFIKANEILPFAPSGRWLNSVRYIVTHKQDIGYGYAAYLANIGFAGTFIAIRHSYGRTALMLAALTLFFSIGSVIILAGRTYIILLAVLVTVALASRLQHKGEVTKPILLILSISVITIIFFASVSYIQPRFYISEASPWTGIETHLLNYVPSALAAFSIQVENGNDLTYGQYTFRTIYAIFHRLGANVEVASLVRPYVNVPFPTNTYTFFSPYYADFGWTGVLAASLGFGALTGAIAKIGICMSRPVASMAFVILLYALLMQFFQDQYMSLLSQWVQLLTATFLLSWKWEIRK